MKIFLSLFACLALLSTKSISQTIYSPSTSEYVISGIEYSQDDIIINRGASVTITGKLYMATAKQIIVKKGGALFVNGGTISHLSKYSGTALQFIPPADLWYGIKVEGTQGELNGFMYKPSEYWPNYNLNIGTAGCVKEFPEYMANCPFGILEMKDAKIEYAFNAVTAGDWNMTSQYMAIPNTGGGWLDIQNSDFYNNWGWNLCFTGYDMFNHSAIKGNLFHSDMAKPTYIPRT